MTDDDPVPPRAPTGRDSGPGWYPLPGEINEQSYWDGAHWTARRRWNGAVWLESGPEAGPVPAAAPPAPQTAAHTSAPRASRPSRSQRRWLVVAVLGVVVAGVVVSALVLSSSGSGTHPSAAPNAIATTSSTSAGPAPTSTTTTAPPESQTPSAAQVAACQADAQSVVVALAAYQAQHGTYPTPPAVWSAATYTGNFAPLTAPTTGQAYLSKAPMTTYYVIEYDALGNVWVAPPGTYGATANAGQSFEGNTDICLAAVG